jgi:hypothetical protein
MNAHLKYFAILFILSGYFFWTGCSKTFVAPKQSDLVEPYKLIRSIPVRYPVSELSEYLYRCDVPDMDISEDGSTILYVVNVNKRSEFSAKKNIIIHESRSILFKNMEMQTDWFFGIEDPTFVDQDQGFLAKLVYVQNNQIKFGVLFNKKIMNDNWYGVGKPIFHPQTRQIAFKVSTNPTSAIQPKKNFVAINGMQATDSHDWIKEDLVFAPISNEAAYAANDGRKWAIYIGNKKITSDFDDITGPVFHPISKSLFYGAKSNDQWNVYENDTAKSPPYQEVSMPTFSENGNNIAYKIKKGNQWCMAFNHQILAGSYQKMGIPVFNPDGTNIAYTVFNGRAGYVIKDGRIISPEFLAVENPTFGADQDKIGYIATIGKREGNLISNLSKFVMVNGHKLTPTFKNSVVFRFDKSGKNIYFAGFDEFEKEIQMGLVNIDNLN